MNILKYIDGLADSSKLTRILRYLRRSDMYKTELGNIVENVHGVTKKILLSHVTKLPFFVKRENNIIKLVLSIKLHEVKEIKDSYFICKSGKELIFTFCHHYGSKVKYSAFKMIVNDSEEIIGCNVTQGTYNETKKVFRYYQVYLN